MIANTEGPIAAGVVIPREIVDGGRTVTAVASEDILDPHIYLTELEQQLGVPARRKRPVNQFVGIDHGHDYEGAGKISVR